MNWKNMTLGKKIASGFGVILILLAGVGGLSYTGVSQIVSNARLVIQGNRLDGNLAQKEVDHLVWANKINALLTDASVTTLNVQTDPHKCAFGKWLYGEGRKEAETLIPELARLFKEVEEPHKKLHESAIAIGENYQVADAALPGFLSAKEVDHLKWAAGINALFMKNDPELMVETDDHKCSLGKWLYGDGSRQAVSGKPELARLVEELKAPHAELHKTAIDIKSAYRQIHPGLLITLKDRLDDHRRWVGTVAQKIIMGNETLGVEKDPGKCALGAFLASETLIEWTRGFPELKAALDAVREPHQKLHQSADFIEANLMSGNTYEAKQIFIERTLPALEEVSRLFTEAVAAEQALVSHQTEAREIYEHRTLPALEETAKALGEVKKQAEWLLEGSVTANYIYSQESIPALEQVQKLLNDIRSEAKKHIMTDEVMLSAAQSTKWNVTVVSSIAIIAGIFLAFFIARGIISVLRGISSQMDEGANQVTSASSQVASASQSLAEGASQQAASIEETSSSMEEMSSMTRQNASNAAQADVLMKETINAVSRASNSMIELTASMAEISRASEETSKIIKTIDEIAFQTNLLALNAAVEAARAGEAGAGFAVVAEEVRNLAMRSAEAARNTATLIEGTVKKVSDGASLVDTTSRTFDDVAQSAAKVGELIGEVTEASKEQDAGIEQVNLAISEMDKVVQQNASTAEESASASEELNAQAESMKQVVDDLLVLVGGHGRKQQAGKRRIPPRTQKGRSLSAPVPAAKVKKSSARRPSEVRPDQVIPFDDDDFTDF